MSVPRSLRKIIGEEVLSKWLDKIGIEENDRFLFTLMLSSIANKLDKPGESYIVAIDMEVSEDADGCLNIKAGNSECGYMEQLGCLAVPRLMDYCGKCHCEEKRRCAKEKEFVEDFDIRYISKYRLKQKISIVDFANLAFIDTDRYRDIERKYIEADTEEKIQIQYAYETFCEIEKKKADENDKYLIQKYDIDKVEAFRKQFNINKSSFVMMCFMSIDDYTQITNHQVEATDTNKISIMKTVQNEYRKIKGKKKD